MDTAPDVSAIRQEAPRLDPLALENKDAATKDGIEMTSTMSDEIMWIHDQVDTPVLDLTGISGGPERVSTEPRRPWRPTGRPEGVIGAGGLYLKGRRRAGSAA